VLSEYEGDKHLIKESAFLTFGILFNPDKSSFLSFSLDD
jgi:hypothetical protein